MKLAILGPREKMMGYSSKRLIEEGKKLFKKVDVVPALKVALKIDEKGLDALYNGKSLKEYDYILPRIDSKRAAIGYPVVRFLDYMGIKKPYFAETILIAHNKFMTLERLVRNNIVVPKTYLTASKDTAKELVGKEGLPIMLKLLSGFGGMGVMYMESKEAIESAIDTMQMLEQEICLEKYIENPGEDLRGIVAGDEVIASFKRIAAKGEKRANVYSGGKAVNFKLTEELEEVALKSAKAVGAKICAVDIISDKNGKPYVIEVNINPGIRGMEKATNINVAFRIINYVKSEIKR
ncbi:MAG: hypothetical protein DRH37_07910 [Deltaproteobacteria bacterium]|nr:MAG: hypothetical protein DRH37_07910 [Deltaproteobacteria bacterium]